MTATVNTTTPSGLKPTIMAVLFYLLIAVSLAAVWYWLPTEVLTRRYFRNIFIQWSPTKDVYGFAFLYFYFWLVPRDWSVLTITAAIVTGLAIIATVVNLACAEFIDAFYLVNGLLGAGIGLLFGYALRVETFVGLYANVFDPKVDTANRIFRAGLVLLIGGWILFVCFMAMRYSFETSSWRRFLNPQWAGWPYMACFTWGWACSYLARREAVAGTL